MGIDLPTVVCLSSLYTTHWTRVRIRVPTKSKEFQSSRKKERGERQEFVNELEDK